MIDMNDKFRVNADVTDIRAVVTKQYQPKPMACARIVAQPYFGYKPRMQTIASHAGVFYG